MKENKSMETLQIGMELQNGKYVVKAVLSSGGFGKTYIIEDKQFKDKFVLKELFIKGVNDRNVDCTTVSVSNRENQKLFDSQKEKFKKEARRLRHLNNKHIVRVYDLFDENDTAYYVMDYIDGESLSNRLKRTKTPLSEQEAMNVLSQVLDALEEVHNLNIWHLDLKPGNILIDKNGNVVLIDFGASKQLSNGEGYETTTSSMCYTPGYAPSEQVDQNMDRIGPWTDLYALGATLYNLLTCNQPPTVSEIQEGNAFVFPVYISDKTKKLVEWMMSPARKKRPQSVAEVKFYLSKCSASVVEDDESTIIGPQVREPIQDNNVGDNSNVGDTSNVDIYYSDDNNNGNKLKWAGAIVGLIVLLSIIVFAVKDKKAQAPVQDTDSIAEVVDTLPDYLWVVDTAAVDSVAVDDYYSYLQVII